MESPTLSSEGRIIHSSFESATFTSTGGATADEIIISGGESKVAGSSSPALSWGSVTKETSVNIRGWLGGGTWTFASDVTASIEVYHGGKHTINTGGGDVEFRGSPREIVIVLTGSETIQVIANTGLISISGNGTGSTVNIFGSHAGITNTASGSPTVSDYALETDDNATAAALATVDGNVDSILVDTAEIGTAGAGLTDLGGMSTAMKAEMNSEVVDTLNTDTYAEPGQEAPGTTVSLAQKISYLYKAWRNKTEQTATTLSLYDYTGTTVDQKSTVSDNGTTASKTEIVSGP